MPAKMLSNKFVYPQTKLDYSRSIFNFNKTHSHNMLTGFIYPEIVIRCNPGDTLPNQFGFNLQSAPLLGPSLDTVVIDVISVWVPDRLVMENFDEWLGNNDRRAWTLKNDIPLPRIPEVYTYNLYDASAGTQDGYIRSKAYLAEHYLAPHIGFRAYNPAALKGSDFPVGSVFHNGFSVMVSRKYDLIWNELFRNQNIQDPILLSKTGLTAGSFDTNDIALYRNGLGKLHQANRLKNVFNMAWMSPAIQSIDLGLFPVHPEQSSIPSSLVGNSLHFVQADGTAIGDINLGLASTGALTDAGTRVSGGNTVLTPDNLWADLSSLTLYGLYYQYCLQRYMDKASLGRREIEYYKNFWGIQSSEAAHDVPQLISQKRYEVNISRVVATANSDNAEGESQGLGTQGAYSVTSVGGTLYPEFTTTEYGHLFVLAVIRTQESIASGIDKELGDYDLLSTYLPVFDHVGFESVEFAEISGSDTSSLTDNNYIFGYQNAWYRYRYQMNTVAGIISPGESLDYWTLGRDFELDSPFTINTNFIAQSPCEFDRMLQLKVCYKQPNETWIETITVEGEEIEVNRKADEFGEPLNSDRYQWLIQFAVAGEFARTMSKDSEPLMLGGM